MFTDRSQNRKHYGKRRNAGYQHSSPFPTIFENPSSKPGKLKAFAKEQIICSSNNKI